MAYYAYKKVRELIPKHLEEKYRAASGDPENWYWNNEYHGDLFDAAADYIKELENEIEILKAANVKVRGWPTAKRGRSRDCSSYH
jgi:alkylhydroperoxidase family enzyme